VEFFRVKNWEHHQHYKNRNPSWIKLYTSLLDNFEFLSLPETTRLLAFNVLMLAAKTNNKMPNDPDWLKARFCLSDADLGALYLMDFIEIWCASKMLADDASAKERKIERNIGPKALHPEAEKARARFLQGVPR
jgi:hypothetical protein